MGSMEKEGSFNQSCSHTDFYGFKGFNDQYGNFFFFSVQLGLHSTQGMVVFFC